MKLINQCNLYIALWCLYLLQGTAYTSGSWISVTVLAIVIVMSFFHVIKVSLIKKKPMYIKGLTVLLSLFVLYGAILIMTDGFRSSGMNSKPTIDYLKGFFISLLPIYSFYYYSIQGQLNRKVLLFWVPIFFIVAVLLYYRIQREALEAMIYYSENITNNAGYLFLSLIPCLYIYKSKSIQILGIVICLLFVLYGMKRGAILLSVVAVAVFYFQNAKKLSPNRRLLFSIGVVIIGVILLNYLQDSLFQNDYFNLRFEQTLEGNTSGRDEIYNTLIDSYWNDFNPIQQLIGIGAYGSLKTTGMFAHNDWIEILINQGLAGLIIFIYYWFCFFKTTRDNSISSQSRDLIFLVFIITFMRSFFSMSISDNTIFMSSILGFGLANGWDNKQHL